MAQDALRLEIEINNELDEGLKKYRMAHKRADVRARIKVGIQLINNVVNGSARDSVVPPIDTGRLRGSGSVFYGSKLAFVTPKVKGSGTPNYDYKGPDRQITVGFNTPYAARLHETEWTPGQVSEQSGDVGNKYLERHLKADGPELMKLYAKLLEMGTK